MMKLPLHKLLIKSCLSISFPLHDYIASIIWFSLNGAVVSTESYNLANCVCQMCLLACGLSLQPSLLRAIFNVDPDEVRSLILKKEDVNVQVSLAQLSGSKCPLWLHRCVKRPPVHDQCVHKSCNESRSRHSLQLIWLLIDQANAWVPSGSFQSYIVSVSQDSSNLPKAWRMK